MVITPEIIVILCDHAEELELSLSEIGMLENKELGVPTEDFPRAPYPTDQQLPQSFLAYWIDDEVARFYVKVDAITAEGYTLSCTIDRQIESHKWGETPHFARQLGRLLMYQTAT